MLDSTDVEMEPAPTAMAAATVKDAKGEWVIEFVNQLFLRLRPDIDAHFARIIASSEWLSNRHLEPRIAAQRWHAKTPARR